jgi:HlyD family secretion protein
MTAVIYDHSQLNNQEIITPHVGGKTMKNIWRWLIAGLIIAGGIGGFLWFRNRRNQQQGTEVLRRAEVIRDDLIISVAASGNVTANQKATLNFETPGTVAEVNVEVGDEVEKGELLAELETESLALALEEAQTRLEEAEKENVRQIEQAELNLTAAQLQLKQAELRVPGLGTAAAGVRSARANLERVRQGASEEDVRIAERQVEEARNALWGQQVQRDATCGAVKFGQATQTQCDAAQAAVQQAEERVRITELQLQKTRSGASTPDIEAAEAQLAQAQSEYSRAASENEAQQEGLEILRTEVRRAELNLERLQEGVDPLLELAVRRAQQNLDNARLIAPFSGVIGSVNLQQGVQVASSLSAVTLVDPSVFYVEVTVDETDISKLALDQRVETIVDAYPETTLIGEIETIAPAPTNVGGIVSYPVRIRLEPEQQEGVEIRDGMTASVLIQAKQVEDVLLVPNWAVRTDQNTSETYTYRLQDGTPKRVPVTLGERNETYTIVEEGLAAGDTVVLIAEERNLLEFTGPPSQGQ